MPVLGMGLDPDLPARCLGSVVSFRGMDMDLYRSLCSVGRDESVNRGGALVSTVSSSHLVNFLTLFFYLDKLSYFLF